MVDKEKITNELEQIVNEFNSKFKDWMTTTGCRANFSWKYGMHQDVKALELHSVDLIVYRKEKQNILQQLVEKTNV